MAIIDIATIDFGDKTEGLSGAAYGSFQKKRGNTQTDEAEYGGRIEFDTNKTITWLQGSAEHDKASGITTDKNSFLHLRHIHQIYNPNWALELYTQFKKDEFKDIELRRLYGVGPRYKVMDSAFYGKLFFGLSVLDEHIEYTNPAVNPSEHNTRTNVYTSYKLAINERFDFSFISYYQPKIGDTSDYMMSASSEMTIHLTKVFDLSYLLEFDYDSKPAKTVGKTDTQQKLSFVYRFGENDPFSQYAKNILASVDNLDDMNASKVIAVEVNTKIEDIKNSSDTVTGKWVFDEETFSIFPDGKGSYVSRDGIYKEKLEWTLVSTDTHEGSAVAKNQGTKLVVIRFSDEEDRPLRVENYLWSEDTLLGLAGDQVKLFKR